MQYKNIVTIAFGVFLLLPFQASAQIWCDPLLGFCSDPYGALNQSIQQQQSQVQAQQQAWQRMQDKESALKSQYGYAAYSSCTDNMLNIDGGNISQVTMYLNADEPCMASYKTNSTPSISNDQKCANKFGVGTTWTGKTDSVGNPECQCASGYASTNGACVLSAATTPTCTANSTYNGSQCICNTGYSNLSGYCISNLAALAALNPPSKANDQTCQSSYGTHSIWTGEKNAQGGIVCGCGTSFDWNSSRTACVAPVTITTSNSHSSGLAANQIAAILSLLQSFGADQSVINNVRVSLGQ